MVYTIPSRSSDLRPRWYTPMADIATKNGGEHDLTPRMKYMMVRLENWGRSILYHLIPYSKKQIHISVMTKMRI